MHSARIQHFVITVLATLALLALVAVYQYVSSTLFGKDIVRCVTLLTLITVMRYQCGPRIRVQDQKCLLLGLVHLPVPMMTHCPWLWAPSPMTGLSVG